MAGNPNRLSRFWGELKRRKVLPFVIGYVAACFAIIEFFLNATETFSLPQETVRLLYLLSAIGIPVVILLPWIINRKKEEELREHPYQKTEPLRAERKKTLHNLPVQLTTFIGREREMEVVRTLIDEHRLVTLTGAGGCGKTRLACEVAGTIIQSYKDGVWFVDLAPITSGGLVAKEITEVLKIKEIPNVPVVQVLINEIKDLDLLIILDNCEHLIKTCAEIAVKLVQSVPGLSILVTSREALSVTGEQIWRVPSLSLIDPRIIVDVEQARDSEAVMLFTNRARMNNPEFELESANVNEVVTICNKLDGIPLALELVASRTKHMNAHMILERFSDRFDQLSLSGPGISRRQQTLHATIEWSYNLLSRNEKALFVRLAVFSGGFNVEAAEHVCMDDQLPSEIVLDTLSRLVDRSMVYTLKGEDQSMRYNRLETLRQFAQQKLQSKQEETTFRNRHLQYYLAMAEEARSEQFESQLRWLNRLEQEHDNLIGALNWSDRHSPEAFVKLSGALAWFWSMHSHISTGKDYLERAMSRGVGKSGDYAQVLYGLAMIVLYFGELPRSIELLQQSLEIWRQLDNLWEQAIVLSYFSFVVAASGDTETGLRYSEESVEIARSIGHPFLINYCLIDLCQSYIRTKQYDRAQPIIEEFLDSADEQRHPDLILRTRRFLGDCALGRKDFDKAEEAYGLALETALKYGNVLDAVFELQGIAFAVSGQSRWGKAIQLDAAAREKARILGSSTLGLIKDYDDRIAHYIGMARDNLGDKLTRAYEEKGVRIGFESAVNYALDRSKD